MNLYGFVGNDGVARWDRLGLYQNEAGNELVGPPCCKGKPGVELVTDAAGERCCSDETEEVELNSDYGKNDHIGHTWLSSRDGSWGSYPKFNVSEYEGMAEFIKGRGKNRDGITKSPDPHQVRHDKDGTKPTATKKFKLCPGSYKKFMDSIKSNINSDWSVPNVPARNCTGWACSRIGDAGVSIPGSKDSRLRPSSIK